MKDTGNVLFEAQEFPKAILKCMFSKSWHPFVCPRCTVNVRTGWYIAACWLRLKQYNLVKYNCDLAMKFDAYNVEVRYTGALAMLNLEMGNDARLELDLEVALNFEPKNIFGLKELKMLEKYGLNGESAKGTKGVHNGGSIWPLHMRKS